MLASDPKTLMAYRECCFSRTDTLTQAVVAQVDPMREFVVMAQGPRRLLLRRMLALSPSAIVRLPRQRMPRQSGRQPRVSRDGLSSCFADRRSGDRGVPVAP